MISLHCASIEESKLLLAGILNGGKKLWMNVGNLILNWTFPTLLAATYGIAAKKITHAIEVAAFADETLTRAIGVVGPLARRIIFSGLSNKVLRLMNDADLIFLHCGSPHCRQAWVTYLWLLQDEILRRTCIGLSYIWVHTNSCDDANHSTVSTWRATNQLATKRAVVLST